MRIALLVPHDRLPVQLRSPGYRDLENQVVAAELHGLSAVWLTDAAVVPAPQRLPTLRLLEHLSAVTDRIDLGLVLRLPPEPLRPLLAEQIAALDERSDGRARLALECLPGDDLEAALALLAHIGALMGLGRGARPAARLQLRVDPARVASAGAHGYGLLLPDGSDSVGEHGEPARTPVPNRPGWVAHTLTLVMADSDLGVAELARGIATAPARQPTARRLLRGTPTQVLQTLAHEPTFRAIDELVCEVAPPGVRPEQALTSIALLGEHILPQLQPAVWQRPPALPSATTRVRARAPRVRARGA
ncbi:MAG: LLM class flavin-dependent oxidoreductase [Chloroflexales bacterium]|nr:LLM class flavin-dependent oxidoreductase [Chloroflexales bacterium]